MCAGTVTECGTTTAWVQASDAVPEGCSTDLCIDFDVQAYEVAAAVAGELVLHAGISPAPALQLIKKVGHNLQQPLPDSPQNKDNSPSDKDRKKRIRAINTVPKNRRQCCKQQRHKGYSATTSNKINRQ